MSKLLSRIISWIKTSSYLLKHHLLVRRQIVLHFSDEDLVVIFHSIGELKSNRNAKRFVSKSHRNKFHDGLHRVFNCNCKFIGVVWVVVCRLNGDEQRCQWIQEHRQEMSWASFEKTFLWDVWIIDDHLKKTNPLDNMSAVQQTDFKSFMQKLVQETFDSIAQYCVVFSSGILKIRKKLLSSSK